MEPSLLLALLASLRILIPYGSATELPAAPRLSVSPDKREYLIGDVVSLRCEAPPSPEPIQGFRFSGAGGWAADVRSSGRVFTFRVNVTGPAAGGAHTCAYALRGPARRARLSQHSDAVFIVVKARPARPTLSLDAPDGAVPEGRPLLLTCSAPGPPARRRFRFFRDGSETAPGAEADPSGSGARLRVARAGLNHTGNFSCSYEEEEEAEGRWIPSEPSAAVAVRVTAPPPAAAGGPVPAWAVPAAAAAAALALLLLPLAAWGCRRRRGGARWKGLRGRDDAGSCPLDPLG